MPIKIKNILAKNSGIALIEVMVAVFVLSVGLLGIAGLQVTGIKSNHTALIHTQSTQLIYDLADRMRANMPGSKAGGYLGTAAPAESYNCSDSFPGAGTPGAPTICSPTEMAHADLDWIFSLAANTMPFVSAAISCTSPAGVTAVADTAAEDCGNNYTYTLTITWLQQDGDSGLINKSSTIEFLP